MAYSANVFNILAKESYRVNYLLYFLLCLRIEIDKNLKQGGENHVRQ